MNKDKFKNGYEPRDGWPFATPYDDGAEAVKKAPANVKKDADRLLKNQNKKD